MLQGKSKHKTSQPNTMRSVTLFHQMAMYGHLANQRQTIREDHPQVEELGVLCVCGRIRCCTPHDLNSELKQGLEL